MGNALNSGFNDLSRLTLKISPPLFHHTHSDNVAVSCDRRKARRLTTFCKGICFSARTIAPLERVHVRVADVSSLWSGALRFGFSSHDPASLVGSSLPRYACPDLTNRPGYWVKALPERLASRGTVITFCYTRNGDVVYGINGEDKGVFLNSVDVIRPLWAIIDIYGNTTAIEFVEGHLSSSLPLQADIDISMDLPDESVLRTQQPSIDAPLIDIGKMSPTRAITDTDPVKPSLPPVASSASTTKWNHTLPLLPSIFHSDTTGRNVFVSPDGTVAVRRANEYCNAYVFSRNPCRLDDALCISILAIDVSFSGSLAFGLTCCDPATLWTDLLPDDSDLLLDRPEYWVVNKDVCASPEVGDELIFHLTKEGEVHYIRNGHRISTLMHVDTTLPLWALFDIYGAVQKVKFLGTVRDYLLVTGSTGSTTANNVNQLTAARGVHEILSASASLTPPPRPPPPRFSPQRREHQSSLPPALPPKERRGTTPFSSAGTTKISASHVAPPPLPQPRQKCKETSPVGCSRSAVADRLASKVVPPLPVDSDDTEHKVELVSTQSALLESGNTNVPRCDSHAAQLELDAPSVGLKGRTVPRALSNSHWPLDAATSSTKGSLNLPLDRASATECSVCLEQPIDCVLYACGHLCMCYECAVGVHHAGSEGGSCPICRQTIRDVIKIYRS